MNYYKVFPTGRDLSLSSNADARDFIRLQTKHLPIEVRDVEGKISCSLISEGAGRGMFAAKNFRAKEILFAEDAFISTTMNSAHHCNYCTKPLSQSVVHCACNENYCR